MQNVTLFIEEIKAIQDAFGFQSNQDFMEHGCFLDVTTRNGLQGYEYTVEVKVEPKTEDMNTLLKLSPRSVAMLEEKFGESLRIRAYQGKLFPGIAFLIERKMAPYDGGELVDF